MSSARAPPSSARSNLVPSPYHRVQLTSVSDEDDGSIIDIVPSPAPPSLEADSQETNVDDDDVPPSSPPAVYDSPSPPRPSDILIDPSVLSDSLTRGAAPAGKMAEASKKLKIGLAVLVVVVAIIVSIVLSSVHTIEEGNVGVYFRAGALMETLTHPGVQFMAPLVVTVQEIQIRPQTDTLRPIVSITKDGIQNTFNDVQVISRVKVDKLIMLIKKFGINFRAALIYDRVKEELRIFCANHTIDDVYNTKVREL